MREPNGEQKKAIEHSGGVVLNAGAGSGKTFVLIEHVVYLLKRKFPKQNFIEGKTFKEVESFFSTVVLITFTKKAANEISIRLIDRIEMEEDKADKDKMLFWNCVRQSLDFLVMTTIDGFCYRLISQGYIGDIAHSFEISDEEQRDKKNK